MDAYAWLFDWLHLLARWFHLVVGAAWIGASFYFVWLNNNVRPLPDGDDLLAGGLWAVHGGAFYQVRKYRGAPESLPEILHWFKWEAYLTWLSGVTLLGVVFWLNPSLMMVRTDGPIGPGASVAVGAASLLVGWLVYHALCRSPLARHPRVLAAVGFTLIGLASFGLAQLLSTRAAYIHVGAMLGTMMAWNVFFVIIPGQRAMVDAMVANQPAPVERGQEAALRSLHNNYFTLPVLFIMLSNHFPFTYGHPLGWAVLIALGLLGAGVKHWMNLHERGSHAFWILPAVAIALMSLAFVSHGPPPARPERPVPSFAEVQEVIDRRCVACHSAKPTQPGVLEAPKGLRLDVPEHIPQNAALIHAQAVATQVMPLGNLTGMTPEERELLDAWIAAGAPLR